MLNGCQLIDGDERTGKFTFNAVDAATGKQIPPVFSEAGGQDVADACSAAHNARDAYGETTPAERAAFLRLCADKIDALGDTLTQRAMAETGLPQARLEGERGRTVGQLRLFAEEVESGRWMRARIDHADPARTPPKPDLRLAMIPLGPVAIFGASNFPLAFSVAGGDTASALAAGCPVVVKGHPAHPGTSELVGRAMAEAVRESGLPAGVFSLLQGTPYELGEALVKHPAITAVGFTGSRAGGLALMRHAASRSVPIPVFAEMSSINPVIILPGKLSDAAEDLGQAYVASLTLGAGQFCTNPGIVLTLGGGAYERFIASTISYLCEAPAQTMLTAGIRDAYSEGIARLSRRTGAQLAGVGKNGHAAQATARVYTMDAEEFMADPAFAEENFGPSSVIVRCRDLDEMKQLLEGMEGQLTATIHLNSADQPAASALLPVLRKKAGRILANGWPTGVDVTHAMVHGGPFPATSDGRSTSVGTMAIERFLRPVAYQDMPAGLLPDALRDEHQGFPRLIDGKLES